MAWSRRGTRFQRARISQRPSTLKTCSSSGFTLVEMLVAVTLVLLMMVMFGEIFQVASSSVTKQRVLSDNDQNARTFVTVFRADLDKRSFRTVVPFFPREQSSNSGTPFELREGYFYISCNNPNDGTDDVLQFTALTTVHTKSSDENLYFGKARTLPTPGSFLGTPNQPDRDDGQITVNSAGASRAGEICYWMRGGNLYRRLMLLRDPVPAPGMDTNTPSQPSYYNAGPPASNIDYFLPGGVYSNSPITVPNPNFWGDFDYSAHALPISIAPFKARAVFNGLESLANDTPPSAYSAWVPSLGQTWNRYGFHHSPNFSVFLYPGIVVSPPLPPAPVVLQPYGLPREFGAPLPASGVPPDFIGRFTQEETSNPAFLYPHSPGSSPSAVIPNRMDANAVETLNADGVVNTLENGSRAGTDLLLSNVHEFRVEVWDQRLNDFAPIGHSRTLPGLDGIPGTPDDIPGDFHVARRLNPYFGPLLASYSTPPVFGPNIFDTWHPNFDQNTNGVLGDIPDRPPYRPLSWDPTGVSGEVPNSASGNPVFWTPNQAYIVGDVVFPRTEDRNGNGILDAGEDGLNGFPSNGVLDRRLTEDINSNNVLDGIYEDLNYNGMLDPGEDLNSNGLIDGEDGRYRFPIDSRINSTDPPFFPFGLTYAYRCTQAGTSGPFSSDEPVSNGLMGGRWSTVPGTTIRENAAGTPVWIVDYNVRPLRAIRVTIRFQHPQSKQMRQVSIVHSLRDTTTNVRSAPNTTSGP